MKNMKIFGAESAAATVNSSTSSQVSGKKYEMIWKEENRAFQIKALIDIRADDGRIVVAAGTIGGFITGEENLSQEGRCWIESGSAVLGNARVSEDGYIGYGSVVKDNASVSGSAYVRRTRLEGDVALRGRVIVQNTALSGFAVLDGEFRIGEGGIISIHQNTKKEERQEAYLRDCELYYVCG